MAHVLQQLGSVLARLLEQLAVRTEDGRLIYQDMLCMSWVAVCDVHRHGKQQDSIQNGETLGRYGRSPYPPAQLDLLEPSSTNGPQI
jgi:hypothetical protein